MAVSPLTPAPTTATRILPGHGTCRCSSGLPVGVGVGVSRVKVRVTASTCCDCHCTVEIPRHSSIFATIKNIYSLLFWGN